MELGYRQQMAGTHIAAGSPSPIEEGTQEGRLYGLPSCVYVAIRIARDTR